MTILQSPCHSMVNGSRTVLALVILLFLFIPPVPAFGTTAKPADVTVDPAAKAAVKKDVKCLKCHSKSKTKLLGDGAEMSLLVPLSDYISSAHGKTGCVSCHQEIANKKHPAKKYRIEISSQRDYSVERNSVCRDCHEEKYAQYEGSIHATMVSHGSRTAPVCSDCHSAHAVEPMTVYQPVTGLPCKNCHEDVFHAYSLSVHGKARENGNVIRAAHIQAPACVDCHRAHDISAVDSRARLRSLCLDCHAGASLAHKQWLPNASRHLEVISCAACHAPLVERRIDLELHNNPVQAGSSVTHEKLQQKLRNIDAMGGTVNPEEFRMLMNGNGTDKVPGVILRGRLETSSGVKAHSLANKSLAVRSCDSCHKKGAEPFQNVTVSITNEEGRRQHYAADKEILDSLLSVESVNDFYTIGGTRMPLLDVLVVLSLFAGIAIPIGHISLGRILKRKVAKENKHV